jgi:hypothetical protein
VAAQSNKLWSENDRLAEKYQSPPSMGTNDPSSEKNPLDVVKLFFDQKFKNKIKILVDHDDDEGRTPLHLAVMLNRFSFVEYLLENGASIEVRYAVLSSD